MGLRRLTAALAAAILVLACGPGLDLKDDISPSHDVSHDMSLDRAPSEAWVCRDWNDTLTGHVMELRAIVLPPYVYARGSYERLGLSMDADKVWVRETKPDYFEKGRCP